MEKEIKVLLGVGLAIIAAGIALFALSPSQPSSNTPETVSKESLIKETSYIKGNRDAKVTLVEFADFECPACAQFAPIFNQLEDEYKDNGDVAFVFRHFPLPMHRHANISARAAESAGEQGKFWEMYNLLFQNQSEWSNANNPEERFVNYAQTLGLNIDEFRKTMDQEYISERISQDVNEGNSIGVDRTPTVFLNGVVQNRLSYDALKAAIEAELAR